METFLYVVALMYGLYSIVGAFVMVTTNTLSAIIFKVVPFLSGLCLIVVAAHHFGWLQQLISGS